MFIFHHQFLIDRIWEGLKMADHVSSRSLANPMVWGTAILLILQYLQWVLMYIYILIGKNTMKSPEVSPLLWVKPPNMYLK
jgi:hypothetical protein